MSGDGIVLRPFRGAPDIPGMAALCNARTRRDGQGEYLSPATMAEQYAHLTRCDPAHDIRVAELAGAVVGYARTTWADTGEGDRDHWLIVEADPRRRGPRGRRCSTGASSGPWRSRRSRWHRRGA